MVMRNGVEMTQEQASQLDYQDAERLMAAKRYREAMTRYQTIATTPYKTTVADNALLRLAQIQKIQKQPKAAIQNLETLITNFGDSDVYDIAKEELGLLYYGEKDYTRAAEVLSTLNWGKIPEPRKSKLEKVVRFSFDQSNLPQKKLAFLITYSDSLADGVTALESRKEIVDALDEVGDVAFLQKILDDREDKFPGGYIQFKLAKLAYHAGDLDAARKYVTSFLNRNPNHEYAREAAELSERLYRSERVDPKAVGLLAPLSSTNTQYAEQLIQGAALAMNLFSPQVPGSDPVRLYIEDSGDTPEQAVAALENLIRKHNIVAAIGPLFAKQSQAASITAVDSGLPIMSLSAAEGITQIGDTVFRSSITKSEQAANLAYIAKDILGIQRAAILYPTTNYGGEFMKFFWDAFKSRGGEIRAVESYDPNSKEIATAIKKMVGLSPIEHRAREICGREQVSTPSRPCYAQDKLPPIVDFEAVFIPDNYDIAMQVAPTLAYYDVQGIQILGTNLWNTNELFHGDSAEYMQGAIFLDGFFKDKKSPPVPQFVERFYASFGREPTIFEASTYDSVAIVLNLIDKEHPASRRAMKDALYRVKEFPGITGPISIQPNREAVRRLTVLTVEGNKIVELE
jgi:branched-chain amino acid transport system substrate-binding protein